MNSVPKLAKWIVLPLLVVAVLYGAYSMFNSSSSKGADDGVRDVNSIDYSPATDTDHQSVEQTKEDIANHEDNAKPEISSNNSQASNKSSLTPVITTASQDEDNIIRVRALVNSNESGTCNAVFSRNSSEFSQAVGTTWETTYYQCNPINVSVDKFSSSGYWNVKIVFNSNNKEGVSDSRQFEVNK